MNITELYEWATKNGVEDYEIEIQYRDGGGYYHGTPKAAIFQAHPGHLLRPAPDYHAGTPTGRSHAGSRSR